MTYLMSPIYCPDYVLDIDVGSTGVAFSLILFLIIANTVASNSCFLLVSISRKTWQLLMNELGWEYRIHDLRHHFIMVLFSGELIHV